jgi:uncharacterized small protein (DUF1192 family)
MMASLFADEELPARRKAHEIGQDLGLLSLEEIDERIGILRAEIERLEGARSRKGASKAAADAFFRKMT